MQSTQRQKLRNQLQEGVASQDFDSLAFELFLYQSCYNPVYRHFLEALNRKPSQFEHYSQVPFLPIAFFKWHKVACLENPSRYFESSGTGGMQRSKHYFESLSLYELAFLNGFQRFYGKPNEWVILGLLPNYLAQSNSSLVYMVDKLIGLSGKKESGFYLNETQKLYELLEKLAAKNAKTWLIGVSYALLDFSLQKPVAWPELVVVETGGMKGRKKELLRDELHTEILKNWPLNSIHSEYGMTELFSQAYRIDASGFRPAPSMRVQIHHAQNPLEKIAPGQTGAIHVIDLANLDTCSFIATQDLGLMKQEPNFEVLGRFDDSDLRGCNLMAMN